MLDRKINQCIRKSLIKLQNLTEKPYCKVERETAMKNKRDKIFKNNKQ